MGRVAEFYQVAIFSRSPGCATLAEIPRFLASRHSAPGHALRLSGGLVLAQVSRFCHSGRDPRFLASRRSAPGHALRLSGGLVLAQVSRFCHPGRDPQVLASRRIAPMAWWSGSGAPVFWHFVCFFSVFLLD